MNAKKSPGESQGSSLNPGSSNPNTDDRNLSKVGLFYGVTAYLIWGSFPLIVAMLAFAGPFEIIGWRIIFGFLVAAILTTVTKNWSGIVAVLKNRKLMKWQAIATISVMANWIIYVYGVASHQTIETALGYFINPLLTTLLAVWFLGERLSRLQKYATAIGGVAVTFLTIDYGKPPILALALAASFGIYGLSKNKLGGKVSALNSFALESGILLPVAVVILVIISFTTPGLKFASQGAWGSIGLMFFGLMTAVPLILFGAAAKHLPLRYIGFIQYLTPVIQFSIALLVFHEPMPAARWIGFGLVWIGLAVLIFDALRRNRASVTNS